MRRWQEKVLATGGLLAMTLGFGCGGGQIVDPQPPGALLRLPAEILQPGEPFEAPLVAPDGGVAVLRIVRGALPDGLAVDAAGALTGTPTTPGQLARFTVRSENAFGDPVEQMDQVVAVGVRDTTLASPSSVARQGDVLRFEHDWGTALSSAWAWDAQLGLVWPMRAEVGLVGASLAPAGRALSLVVAGSGAGGVFDVEEPPADESIQVVAQLTWQGDADIDLCVVAQLERAATVEIGAEEPVYEEGGDWLVRHELAESMAPGPEVVTFSKDLPTGRWALVATKAAGGAVEVPMWLSVRRRDGVVVAERRYDALLSDVSTGRVESDVSARTQSFKPLGVLVVGADREVSFEPVTGSDVYGVMGPNQAR